MANSIGRYEIREELGSGGMATVYLAYDPRLDRQVALKLMDQQLSVEPTFAARFEREAKTVASLEHSAIVSLYDYGEADGWLYLVMRYMKGGSLKQLIARGPLTPRNAYGVARRIGSALDKAHRSGIIHRDLKPGNILLDEDQEAFLSDFGIVKVAQGDTEFLTETGQTMGTYAYMSPEQIMGGELDGRSDIYALGVVLYEMLTGSHPFGDVSTSGAMAIAHAQRPVPDATKVNPALPAALTPIIQKAMAKDREDRYATGREMAAAMYDVLAGKTAPVAPSEKLAAEPPAAKEPVPDKPAQQTAVVPPPQRPSGRPATEEKRKTPLWIFAVVGVVAIACIAIAALVGIPLITGTDDENENSSRPSGEVVTDDDSMNDANENDEGPTAVPRGNSAMVNVPGSYQDLVGCAEIWDPACPATALTEGDDGLWSASYELPAGIYEVKVALEGSWATNYGVGGQLNGDNFRFRVAEDGVVSFVYDPATNLLTIDAPGGPISADAEVLYEKAQESAFANDDPQLALEQISRALELDPNAAHFYHLRAVILSDRLQEHDAALADIEKAIELEPDFFDNYAARGNIYAAIGDLANAEADFSRAIEMEPGNGYLHMGLANVYKLSGDVDRARDSYATAIRIDPANLDFYTTYAAAILHDGLGSPGDALEILTVCLEKVRNRAYWCHWERAWVNDGQGRLDEAAADLEAFLEMVPADDCPDCQRDARNYLRNRP